MFEGYLELGGVELLNSARAKGYADTADCPINWLQCPPCGGIRDVLGHEVYTYDNIEDAPWYDEQDPTTHRFLGAHAITIEGIPDSTREAGVQEAITDGGVVGRTRRATRRMRVRALLQAQGEDALEYGFSWLDAALQANHCQTHSDTCGAADARIFAACPPERSEITMPEPIWNDPITNMATYPAMEIATTPTVLRTNLATNPSFEATTATTVEVRRNLAIDPRKVGAVPASSSGATYSLISDFPGTFTSALRAARTATGNVRLGEIGIGLAMPAAGQTLAIRVQIRASEAVSVQFFARPDMTNTSGQVLLQAVAIAAGYSEITVIGPSMTSPATATSGIAMLASVGTIGATLDMSAALVEQSPVSGTYFDGSTVPTSPDFSYAWAGTVNASASVQYGIAVPSIPAYYSTLAFSSTEWASTGLKSARVRSTKPTTGSEAMLFLGGGFGNKVYMVPGKTYTAIAKVRVDAPRAVDHTSARRLSIRIDGGAGGGMVSSEQAPNAAGVYELRVTHTIPLDAVGSMVQFSHWGSSSDPDLWLDDYLLVEGTYTGPYFDGSTPAKVRRNLASVPVPTAGYFYNANSGAVNTIARDTTVVRRPGTASSQQTRLAATPSIVIGSWYCVGGYTWSNAGRFAVAAGMTYTMTLYARASVANAEMAPSVQFFDTAGVRVGGTIYGPVQPMPTIDTWYRSVQTVTVPAGAVSMGGLFDVRGPMGYLTVGGEQAWIQDVMVEEGSAVGEFFDGATAVAPYSAGWQGTAGVSPSYLYDPDFTYAWTGTANASTSTQSAMNMTGVSPTTGRGWDYAHIDPVEGTVVRVESSTTKAIEVGFSSSGLVASSGVLTTILVRAKASRQQTLTLRLGTTAGSSKSFTITNEWQDFRAAVPVGAFTSTQHIGLLFNSAQAGDLFDIAHVLIVAGDYTGPYFDGSFPDSTEDDLKVIGAHLDEYAWTGATDASTSTHRTGIVVATPDPVAYEKAIERLVRNMHNVTAVSGPIVEQKLHRDNAWGYIVEFVLVAATPFMYGVTRPVESEPSVPIVVQDVPFNLVPYPSAELASGSVIAATNYSDNPSVELGLTNWGKGSGAVVAADVVQSQSDVASGGLASVGTKSVRERFTASNTSASSGTVRADNTTATFPTAQAGQRMSVNMWVNAQVVSGTAVLSSVEVYAVWRNGTTQLSADLVGAAPAGGGAVSKKSMLVPVGATNVIIRAQANLASWSTGAIVDLYADAVAATIP